MTETYRKHYGEGGYTFAEAQAKKFKVDEAHGFFDNPNTAWKEAKIVDDPRGGYMIVHETKR